MRSHLATHCECGNPIEDPRLPCPDPLCENSPDDGLLFFHRFYGARNGLRAQILELTFIRYRDGSKWSWRRLGEPREIWPREEKR